MNHNEILEIMKEMNQSDLTNLEIEHENFKLRISKEVVIQEASINTSSVRENPLSASPVSGVPAYNGGQVGQPMLTEIQAGSIGQVQTQSLVLEPISVSKQENLQTEIIKSPMVGTFYEKPAPDQATFVKVGDRVKKGQVVCIIEAMKLMNEIDSEYDGIITEVLVKNEQMVEFGQPLFRIKVQ